MNLRVGTLYHQMQDEIEEQQVVLELMATEEKDMGITAYEIGQGACYRTSVGSVLTLNQGWVSNTNIQLILRKSFTPSKRELESMPGTSVMLLEVTLSPIVSFGISVAFFLMILVPRQRPQGCERQ